MDSDPIAYYSDARFAVGTNAGLHFVGDWHTHPEPTPRPSEDDLKNMQECFAKSVHELRTFAMIILGTDPLQTGLHVALVGAKSVQILTTDHP